MSAIHRSGFGPFVLSVTLAAVGCSAGAAGPEGEPGPGASTHATSTTATSPPTNEGPTDHSAAIAQLSGQITTLATLSLGEGRSVLFRQVAPGTVVVEEHGQVGQKPIVQSSGKSLAEVYRTLSNGTEPPAAIVKADTERLALAAISAPSVSETGGAPHSAPPPRSSEIKPRPVHPEGPNDTWFQNTFCDNVFESSCILATGAEAVTVWNTQGWSGNNSYTSNVEVYAYEEANVTSPSFFGIDIWNGSTSVWTTSYVSGITAVNTWASANWWVPTPHYFRGWISGGGPTGTVGVAILDFDPQLVSGGFPDDFTWPGPSAFTGYLTFQGMQFTHDQTVNLTLSSGSYSENLGSWPVTYGTPLQDYISDDGVGWFDSPGGNDITVQCSGLSPAGPYAGTVTAVGAQTGQVATIGVSLSHCYPCNPGTAFCGSLFP